MSEVSSPGAAPSLADRLGPACVDLRADLETSRHVFRGEVSYVIVDPLTFSSHRFSRADYAILTRLTSRKPLNVIFDELVEAGELESEDAERFYGFIFSLHKIGFLNLPISDEKSLYNRHVSKRKAKRAQALKSALFFQVPLWQPDAFLSRTAGYARPFFSKTAFSVWILILALASWVVGHNWAEFSAPVGDIFRNENLPLLWISLVALKVAHEFGHAYATRLLGGHVPEMGLYMMVFTPCAYVDSTAAWGFSRKRDRMIVNFAGMYVELFLAALAVIAWSVIPPGLWRSVLHNVVVLASVVTIGFNINPLMRYDGYYALSDFLEIPNLRARSQAEGTRWLKRLVLGVQIPSNEKASLRPFLVGFGLASAIYKVTLVMGISATIAMKFPAVGIAMGAAYLLGEVWSILKRSIPYLWRGEETASVRAWAMSLALLIVVGLPVAVAGLPVPASVTTRGVLSAETDLVLRAVAPGFLREVPVEVGDEVAAGAPLVQLVDEEVDSQLAEVEARLRLAELELEQARGGDPARLEGALEHARQLRRERDERASDLAQLEVRSPSSGRVVRALAREDRGRFVGRGEAVATVTGGAAVVRALLSEEQLVEARPAAGTRVKFRSASSPGETLGGEVLRVVPAARRELDQGFAAHLDPADYAVNPATGRAARGQFELEVRLDDARAAALRHGSTGQLRLEGATEPLGVSLLRKTLTFVRRLTN